MSAPKSWDDVQGVKHVQFRSFPLAADGRAVPPMAAELWAAGCDDETAIFVADQLCRHGITMIRRNSDGTVSYIGAHEWRANNKEQL